jgi:hypothetical protein
MMNRHWLPTNKVFDSFFHCAHFTYTYLETATQKAPHTTNALGAEQLIRANETTGTTVPAVQGKHIINGMQSPICMHVQQEGASPAKYG